MPIDPANFTLDNLLEYLARGHAFPKHGEGMDPDPQMHDVRSFRDSDNAASQAVQNGDRVRQLGPDLHVNTPEDLQNYLRRMLSDPATEGFVQSNGAIQLYNRADRTRVVINTLDNTGDFGSVFRYPTSYEAYNELKVATRREMGRSFNQFDNAVTRDAALTQAQRVVDSVRSNPNMWRSTLANDPGVRASQATDPTTRRLLYPGTQNRTTTGMSPDYLGHTATLDRVNALRSGLDYGSGYVASVEDGRPSRMFFWDKETNVVTEINGRELIQHSFENIPEAERGRLAEQFFELNRPPNATVTEGGYDVLVRSYQAAHNNQLPVAASTKGQLINDLQAGRITTAADQPYASVDDAARILVGFTQEQAQVFDLVPTQLNAEALSRIEDPSVVAAIRDLSTVKEMAHGDDGAEALRLFSETFNQMDQATRTGVVEALGTMARSPLPDAARTAGLAADAVHAADAMDAMGDLARLARTARAGRLGLNFSKAGIITTVVTTGLAVAATSYANGAVLDIADQLHQSGQLSDAAYADYREMMDGVGPMLTGQAADPTVLAIPGTFIVESIAHNRFQEFSDKHQLPQNIHEMLSPSIYAGSSVRGEIGENTFRTIPDDPSQAPVELRALVEAKQAVMQARQDYWRAYDENSPSPFMRAMMSGGEIGGAYAVEVMINSTPGVQAAQAVVDQAEARFQTEFDRALSNPQGARALASLLTDEQLLDIVKATAKFNTSSELHPLIQEYVRAQALDAPWYDLKGAWDNMQARDHARNALMNNPEVMRDYLARVFVPDILPKAHFEPMFDHQEVWEDGRVAHVSAQMLEIDTHPNYILMANAFERLKAGGTLESFEESEIRNYLNHPQSEADRALVDAIKQAYPEQTARFMDEETSVPSVPEPAVTDGATQKYTAGASARP